MFFSTARVTVKRSGIVQFEAAKRVAALANRFELNGRASYLQVLIQKLFSKLATPVCYVSQC
ncbi:hypothetical protein BH688_05730 [Kushneria phosphatilytica]|nr:hypothetical protein BH688_05730 [Kushneria phosphatilytica]